MKTKDSCIHCSSKNTTTRTLLQGKAVDCLDCGKWYLREMTKVELTDALVNQKCK